MDVRIWLLPITFAVIITVPILALVVYMIRESLLMRRNRPYKTLAQHTILNASDRESWMSGVIPQEETQPVVDRFSNRIVPIAQLITLVVLGIAVFVWNNALTVSNSRQEDRLDQLEMQVHALAVTPTVVVNKESEGGAQVQGIQGAAQPATGTPMQQACANLIGRVADAYEKGESSKIGASLEELVKKLGCQNNNPVP
jgi:hypothetical protein